MENRKPRVLADPEYLNGLLREGGEPLYEVFISQNDVVLPHQAEPTQGYEVGWHGAVTEDLRRLKKDGDPDVQGLSKETIDLIGRGFAQEVDGIALSETTPGLQDRLRQQFGDGFKVPSIQPSPSGFLQRLKDERTMGYEGPRVLPEYIPGGLQLALEGGMHENANLTSEQHAKRIQDTISGMHMTQQVKQRREMGVRRPGKVSQEDIKGVQDEIKKSEPQQEPKQQWKRTTPSNKNNDINL